MLTFTDGTTASAIAFAVNRISDSTGVTAEMRNTASVTSGIVFNSNGYGSRSFVSVTAQNGTFGTQDTTGATKNRSVGRDAVATVNGALTVGDGLNVKLNTTALDLDLTLAEDFGAGQTEFAITGGGALFQLGPKVTSNQQVNVGIGSVAASKLGDNNVGFLNDIVTGGKQHAGRRQRGRGEQDHRDRDPTGRRAARAAGRVRAQHARHEHQLPVDRTGERHGQREHDPRRGLRQGDGGADACADPDAGRHQRARDGEHDAAERVVAARRITSGR